MRAWFLIFTSVLSVAHAIVDQPGFRGSIGTTSTNNYFTTSSNDLIDPTKNSLSYSLGLSFRYASGFAIELDFLTSRNKFQSSVTSAVCSSGNNACTYTAACTGTSCNTSNMTIPGTTTGSSVPITSLSTIMAAATSTSTTSTSSATQQPPTTYYDYYTSSGTLLGRSTATNATVTGGTATVYYPYTESLSTTSTITTVSGVSSATTSVTDNSGFMTATSFMLNGIYQFSPETTLNPYIGYGIGYANATAGLGLTTTPTNTTVVTTSTPYVDSAYGAGVPISPNTTVPSTAPTQPSAYLPAPSTSATSSSQVADAWTMTTTEKYNHEAYQLIFGSEFRMDLNNTIDIRLTKRYVRVPSVTTLYPVTGSPMPSIGQEIISSSGSMSTTVSPINAIITSIQIGLLYYG